jgi:hypothetical protein
MGNQIFQRLLLDGRGRAQDGNAAAVLSPTELQGLLRITNILAGAQAVLTRRQQELDQFSNDLKVSYDRLLQIRDAISANPSFSTALQRWMESRGDAGHVTPDSFSTSLDQLEQIRKDQLALSCETNLIWAELASFPTSPGSTAELRRMTNVLQNLHDALGRRQELLGKLAEEVSVKAFDLQQIQGHMSATNFHTWIPMPLLLGIVVAVVGLCSSWLLYFNSRQIFTYPP